MCTPPQGVPRDHGACGGDLSPGRGHRRIGQRVVHACHAPRRRLHDDRHLDRCNRDGRGHRTGQHLPRSARHGTDRPRGRRRAAGALTRSWPPGGRTRLLEPHDLDRRSPRRDRGGGLVGRDTPPRRQWLGGRHRHRAPDGAVGSRWRHQNSGGRDDPWAPPGARGTARRGATPLPTTVPAGRHLLAVRGGHLGTGHSDPRTARALRDGCAPRHGSRTRPHASDGLRHREHARPPPGHLLVGAVPGPPRAAAVDRAARSCHPRRCGSPAAWQRTGHGCADRRGALCADPRHRHQRALGPSHRDRRSAAERGPGSSRRVR